MGSIGLILIVTGVLVFGLFSKKLQGTPITLPIVFTGFGWLIGTAGLGLADIDPGHAVIHTIAELTLILVLFSDAARIDLKRLLADHDLPLRLLTIGMPLTIIMGALIALSIFPEISWPMVLLVATMLAPTDAALGQSVVSSSEVPLRIRQALNVESGLNDGIALPLVLAFAIWAGAPVEEEAGLGDVFTFAALQLTLGPLAGLGVGYVGARLIDAAITRQWITEPFQGVAILCVALAAFALAESIGGNGFISAFTAGLFFGSLIRHHCKYLFEFMESEGHLLTIITFIIFGAVMLPQALNHAVWDTVLLALLFLTLIRMLPIALAVTGLGLSLPSKLFLGWFGPRGIASILFALLILEDYPVPGGEELLACVVITVALSILLHGVTAAPLAKAYGEFVSGRGECAETKAVSEMPVRHGIVHDSQ
jgi:NhaP-type Na+/H+ or K+/H+ antiporter